MGNFVSEGNSGDTRWVKTRSVKAGGGPVPIKKPNSENKRGYRFTS